jgi:trans-aconitate 2-methyltransferase
MITFARDYYPQEKFPNISLMQIDATELTFDSEFDVVFSNAVFHWIKAPETALKSFGKISTLTGYFWLSLGGRETLQRYSKSLTLCLKMKNGALLSRILYSHMAFM